MDIFLLPMMTALVIITYRLWNAPLNFQRVATPQSELHVLPANSGPRVHTAAQSSHRSVWL